MTDKTQPPRRPHRTVYVPDNLASIWTEILKAAQKANLGIGVYICEMWKKNNKK